MKTIEIQRLQQNQWVTHGNYDDPGMAVDEAHRMVATGKFMGVRVLEEEFSDDAETSHAKYLFVHRSTEMVGGDANAASASSAATSAPAASAPAAKKEKAAAGPYFLMGILIVLVAFGAAAMVVLRAMFLGSPG